jgi:hypothetical protein
MIKCTILFIQLFIILLIDLIAKENFDICNIDVLYDQESGYEYFLSKHVLESYLSGKAFDHPIPYSNEESIKLHDDIDEIFQNILYSHPMQEGLAVLTAGAPGAGKTIKLRQDLEANRRNGKNYAYICPDDVCLKNQTRTYIADIKNGDGSKDTLQRAYNKWRPGSNAAAHLILGNLIRAKYAFCFGTTSTSPTAGRLFELLKRQGYYIRLIHVSAHDDVRWESIKERDKTFVQTTEQDVREKGILLPQKIKDPDCHPKLALKVCSLVPDA